MSAAPKTKITKEQIAIIRKSVCPGIKDDDLALFVSRCETTGLDPIARQIYAVYMGGKMSIQVSIDGFRLVAQRTGRYAGQSPVMWCGRDGKWADVWVDDKHPPYAARVGVHIIGGVEPTTAVAKWCEYAQTNRQGQPSGQWAKMPSLMLAKCAESLALRKAFPAELSGLYTTDEMAQAQEQPQTPPPVKPPTPQKTFIGNNEVQKISTLVAEHMEQIPDAADKCREYAHRVKWNKTDGYAGLSIGQYEALTYLLREDLKNAIADSNKTGEQTQLT